PAHPHRPREVENRLAAPHGPVEPARVEHVAGDGSGAQTRDDRGGAFGAGEGERLPTAEGESAEDGGSDEAGPAGDEGSSGHRVTCGASPRCSPRTSPDTRRPTGP